MNISWVNITSNVYQEIIKPLAFRMSADSVHENTVKLGEALGNSSIASNLLEKLFVEDYPTLSQELLGINFNTPIGLAAGFDYEGRLTQVLSKIGFGFQTAGTITNTSYKGNTPPMLGRLPKSKSLMVNKGFKNPGANITIKRLEHLPFEIPVGISIGRTNTVRLKTQKQSIKDILVAFEKFEKSKVQHSYYELNVSCPNLKGNISFYPPKNLKELLNEVDKFKLSKPFLLKMPIDRTNKQTLTLLEIINNSTASGVIFGNLQKNKKDKAFKEGEVDEFKEGNFSGKPTYTRSNELISLTHKHYKSRFVIVGCGGVFSGAEAYEKITRGANLIQLITGMVYMGPQLISQINLDLADTLKARGFKNIKEAVGISTK